MKSKPARQSATSKKPERPEVGTQTSGRSSFFALCQNVIIILEKKSLFLY